MRVCVTGGGGFIGRAVVARLLMDSNHVEVIDHSVGLDVRSSMAAQMISSADAVIHLAGLLGTGELFERPEEAVEANVNGTLAVLKACAEPNIHKTRYVGITMPDVWSNVYQATKRCAKDLASAWNQHRGVKVSHVRAYNVFGPGQKVGSPQKILPTFASKSWAREPIPIWGDGQQWVDLVHVDDVANLLVYAMYNGGQDQVYEAASGEQMTVRLVANLVNSITGSNAGLQHHPMRMGETEHTRFIVTPSYEAGSLRFEWERFKEAVDSYAPDGAHVLAAATEGDVR